MWDIELQHGAEISLSRQIYLALKDGVLTGTLAQDEALPSTRELSKNLGVSRNTVCAAYDMLWTEGYIINHQGAPSRVAAGVSIQSSQAEGSDRNSAKSKPEILWDFKTGQPDLQSFPWKQWSDVVKTAAETLTIQQFSYTGPQGYAPLCIEITLWLQRARNMQVEPENVFITSGSTQALHLLVDMLHREGCGFAIETPSHPGVRTVIMDKGFPVYFLPVDEQGADVSALNHTNISAVYVTPSHQFPLGGILPASRRAALIRLARERDFYIIEDDYDSEFRYTGSPVSPIYSMDSDRVIYVGTFSKTLFPALRIGFVVLPAKLHSRWRHSRNYMDVQNPILEQAALAEFLQTRKMDKHVRRMKKLYGEKRKVLLDALKSEFGDTVIPHGDASGLHIALQFPEHTFSDAFIKRCEENGMRVAPVSRYCEEKSGYSDYLLIGYGHLHVHQIQEGIRILAKTISDFKSEGRNGKAGEWLGDNC